MVFRSIIKRDALIHMLQGIGIFSMIEKRRPLGVVALQNQARVFLAVGNTKDFVGKLLGGEYVCPRDLSSP